ncbi:phosphoadenosine phosphosulfate reductase family protein [uncultured Paraglaciecola sp.]|uniref:phosphoadenosine phosphosulfate reductase domain-containing protein n=1 Tax=uncultured Paraglaciecola sp. TaxID=1765024 RepID=UPI0030DBB197|tara:strand:+ start:67159 stop:67791 length:633 start_codon:yes stop_codon:yes gene_type:complete
MSSIEFSKQQKVKLLNDGYASLAPEEIIDRVLVQAKRPIISTKFGPYAEFFIQMVTRKIPSIPVLWVDTGFLTQAFIDNATRLIEKYHLNIHIQRPKNEVINKYLKDGIPICEARFSTYQQEVKVAPFHAGLTALKPDYWFTGIQKHQTSYRSNLNIFSNYQDDIIRVAPLFNFKNIHIEEHTEFTQKHIKTFLDTTKKSYHSECGIHFS